MGMACSDYGHSPPVEIVLPMLAIGDAMATESDTLWFTVRLSAVSSVDVTFEYATADSTALASAGDYVSIPSGVGLIPAGSDNSLIAVASTDDDYTELPEMFYLILSSPINAVLETGVAAGIIIDNDGQPRLSMWDASAPEGDTLFFIVFLSPVGPLDVSFSWRTADSTAIADSGDYVAVLRTTALIAAGNSSMVISLATVGDVEYEMDESVLILLDSAENAEIVDSVAIGLILNNDFVSYENVIRPILVDTAGCNQTACHRGMVPKGGLNMGDASYDSVMTASGDSEALLIEPNDTDASLLYQRIIKEAGFERMPPNPPGPVLSDENISKIRDWINQGAPDN